jgi:PTS system nitrogen regulatory IIA component
MKLSMQRVADALDLPVSTLRRWIRQGRIPIQRNGTDAEFSRKALDKWAATHNLAFSPHAEPADSQERESADTLEAAMRLGRVCHRIAGKDVKDALKSAVACIDTLDNHIREELLEKLMERERLASTGVGNGIAIPHPRDPLSIPPAAPIIATCFTKNPLDFNAIDDQPVFVLFVMISTSVKQHLHLLSRLSYCIRNRPFRSFLKTRPDAETLLKRVATCEQQLDTLS